VSGAAVEVVVVIEVSPMPGAEFCEPKTGARRGPVVLGVQRGKEPEQPTPGDAPSATFRFEVELRPGPDWKGPHVQGRPGDRFIYLWWGAGDPPVMFRRIKLMLAAVPGDVVAQLQAGGRILAGRLSGVGPDGTPTCASIRPPRITWAVGS
jgi:hypothetical protein